MVDLPFRFGFCSQHTRSLVHLALVTTIHVGIRLVAVPGSVRSPGPGRLPQFRGAITGWNDRLLHALVVWIHKATGYGLEAHALVYWSIGSREKD